MIIAINSSTGSDTLASGAGPSTALTGVLAATHSTTTVNITDAVNLSGVAVDGSAALWIATSSGRRWSAISAISGSSGAWVVTVATAYGTTESGRFWAIGGKRATMTGSSTLFSFDALPSWTIDIQTGETFTSVFVISVAGDHNAPITIKSTISTKPVLTTATDSINLINIAGSAYLVFRHLAFTNTATTKGSDSANGRAIAPVNANVTTCTIDDCTFDGFEVAIDGDNINYYKFTGNGLILVNCEIKNSVLDGIRILGDITICNCNIHNNGDDGVERPASTLNYIIVTNSVFAYNGGMGLHDKGTGSGFVSIIFINNTFRNNTLSDIQINYSNSVFVLINNIFWGTGPYGINLVNTVDVYIARNNGYGGPHSTAERNGISVGINDFVLTVDPGVSSSDSGLNATAGGGVLCKGVANQAPNASINTPGDVGAIPSPIASLSTTSAIDYYDSISRLSNDTGVIYFEWLNSSDSITVTKSLNGAAYVSATGTASFLRMDGSKNIYSLSYNSADRPSTGSVTYKLVSGTTTRFLPLEIIPIDANVTDITAPALAKFFTTNTTKLFADAITGSVVKETAGSTTITGLVNANVISYDSGQDPATLVLDALATDHNTTDTIGSLINILTDITDPWTLDLPGSYLAGSAGNIIGNLPSKIPTNFNTVTIANNGVNLNLSQAVLMTNTDNTIGDCFNAARGQGFGNWVIDRDLKILRIYGPDQSTVLFSFDLDSVDTPTTRTKS